MIIRLAGYERLWRDIENDVARADIARKLDDLATLQQEQAAKPGMAARLGNVLWWLGCVVGCGAALVIIAVALTKTSHLSQEEFYWLLVVVAVCAGIPMLIGRALKYILAGK